MAIDLNTWQQWHRCAQNCQLTCSHEMVCTYIYIKLKYITYEKKYIFAYINMYSIKLMESNLKHKTNNFFYKGFRYRKSQQG